MANYTMTIEEMINHPLVNSIFPEDYPFYVDDEKAKKEFEEKFIMHYYYREIGFGSPFVFKQRLESLIKLRAPYWQQLYETELRCKDIDFMLNKDLKETFIREVESENEINGLNDSSLSSQTSNTATSNQSTSSTSSGTQTATSDNTASGTTTNTHKESSLNDGVAQSSLSDGYLTGTSQDNGTSSQTSSGNQSTILSDEAELSNTSTGNSNSTENSKSSGTSKQEEVGKTVEKTELISQGDIGVTSSAQLLRDWREVLINMDEIIIHECNQLFMKLY